MTIQNTMSLLFLAFALSVAGKSLSCLDKSGKEVPWFFNIKFPYSVTGDDYRFGYLDSSSGTSGFKVLNGSVNSTGYSLSNTINYINSFLGLSIVAFNDEPPNGNASSTNAHAKGVIAFDVANQKGVYIMHSIPNYPNITSTGQIILELPDSATTYAQNIFCLSFEGASITDMIHNLGVIHPVLYFQSGIFLNANFRLNGINSSISDIQVQGGTQVKFLSKSPSYTDGYLYENIIEPYLKVGLEVESWGRPYQPSVCSPYESLNILNLTFSNGDNWTDTSDHSKWAVSIGGSTKYACSCDINRMTSQAKRGGSCICTKYEALNDGLRKIITSTQNCTTTSLEKKIEEEIEELYPKFLGS